MVDTEGKILIGEDGLVKLAANGHGGIFEALVKNKMTDKNIIHMDMGAMVGDNPSDKRALLCLGIESSCDETSAAIVDSNRNILSHIIYSQIPEHQKYGGVVPELAARAHILAIDQVIQQTLDRAGKTIDDIDVIAATAGPGLIGGVLVGWMAATGIAQATGKPLVAVNHLEGHALVPRLHASSANGADGQTNVEFPYLLMLASGGHCQILLVRGVGQYELIGQTLDDIEFLFINDCTKDNSIVILEDVLKEYPNRIPQTRIVSMLSNSGQAAVREHGTKLATGEYIIHCDSDDWVEKDMLQCMYEKADFSIYEVGHSVLSPGSVFSGRDMTSEAAMTKLMWAIGQGMGRKQIEALFKRNLAGEITV